MTEREPAAPDYVLASHPLRRLTTPALVRARRAMFDEFMRICSPRPDESVLDVGVTPDATLRDSNYLERWYPWPERITATSVEDAPDFEANYPGVRFVRTEGVELPFDDGQFDVGFSSAVLEHVGDRERQAQFVAEVVRVCRRAYLTTPNRWFPLELHTYLPLVHWLPQRAHQRILSIVGQRQWATTENLNLVSRTTLIELFPPGTSVEVVGHKVLGLTSNLIAVVGQV